MATVPNTVFSELFAKEVKDKLYASNAFLSTFSNVSEWLNGRKVHIPNYNTSAGILIDGSDESTGADYAYGFDTTATGEADLEMTLKSYRFKPFRVENIDEMVTSYEKMNAVTRNSISELSEKFGTYCLASVAGSVANANIVGTTGASGSTGPNATNRKITTYSDIVSIAKKMDIDNIPAEDRYIVMHPQMYYELLSDSNPAVVNAQNFGEATLPTGVIKKIAGINIMLRSTTAVASGATVGGDFSLLAVKDYAGGAGEAYTSIAFHAPSIAYASSDVKTFINENVAQLYGSVISGEIFGEAKLARTDSKGAYLLFQSAV